ncbi:proton-coupled folate transporter [Aedes aegypti]|uniref:Uncharacterized protein n=1 Tax=Aedes aegypti TaxID=7159 RepID=A0A6I8T5D4_AEDAE|nr:proton-coupled folate transporter [Aedes aegypti]
MPAAATMDETTFSSGSMYSSGEEEILASEGLRLSRSARWRERTSRLVNFEPAVFLFCFALSLSEIELSHQIIYQTCCEQGFQRSECLLVGTEANSPVVQEIEAQVKPVAASVNTVIVAIKSVIPVFGALLLGAWSDRYGRKPVVVITGCGLFVTYVVLTGLNYLSSFVQVNLWFYAIAFIPFSITGGIAILVATIYAFISDISNDQIRTIKMGFMSAVMVAGAALGSFSCRYILEWTDSTTVFMISTICILFGLIYIVLFIDDSIIPGADNELGSNLQTLFSLSLIEDVRQAVVCKRSRFVWQILVLIVGFIAIVELAAGNNSVAYTYAHRHLEWSKKQYSYFQLSESGLKIVANTIGILSFKRIFSWPDTLLALISTISNILCSTIKGFSTVGWQFYMATSLTFFKGTEQAAMLSVCAYLLPSNEIAKFYALAMSVIGLVTIGSEPLYGYFYKETVGSSPGMVYLFESGLYGGALVVLVCVQLLMNKRNQPELLL